jgi:hypothetical protein
MERIQRQDGQAGAYWKAGEVYPALPCRSGGTVKSRADTATAINLSIHLRPVAFVVIQSYIMRRACMYEY